MPDEKLAIQVSYSIKDVTTYNREVPILALFGNAKVVDLIHVAKPSRLKNANSDIF